MKIKSKQLIVETTNLCTAQCITCPREKFTQKPCTMDMGLFRKIVDDAAQYEIESVDVCGYGEPLLDKHLFERFAYLKKAIPNAKIFMSTTGFHLTKDVWDSVIEYVDTIKFSIYGTCAETYEAVHRGNLKYHQSTGNIAGFAAYLSNSAKKPHTIGLFLVTGINEHEKDKWIGIWGQLLDEIMVWKPHNWINGRKYRTLDRKSQRSCGRPDNAPMYIHADGKISPCCFDPNKLIQLGDMNAQTIEDVYKGWPYVALRQAHDRKDFSAYACQDCDQTNHNPGVLVYASNKNRQVGQLVSNAQKICGGENASV